LAQQNIWTIEPEIDTGLPSRELAIQAFIGAEEILARLGGALLITCDRVEVADGEHVTERYIFRYDTYAGRARDGRDQPQQEKLEPEPELEPVDA
jgi:hypothetical protein